MEFQRGRKEYNSFSSTKKTEKELSLPTLGIVQHKSFSGPISTARAPSSDSLTPPRQDVDLNIYMSYGCQRQTVIYRDIK